MKQSTRLPFSKIVLLSLDRIKQHESLGGCDRSRPRANRAYHRVREVKIMRDQHARC
jgi:hypothetical protein